MHRCAQWESNETKREVILLHSDFTIIQHKFPDQKDITIYPIADIHLGAAEHMESAWREFRTKILEEENAYITLGGDLVNNGIKSSVSNIYDETLRPREAKRLMVEMLTPLKSRILCAVSGNHEKRSSKEVDDDIVYDIMCKMDIEERYRENIAFIKLQFGERVMTGELRPTYVICVTHGNGGGILSGGAVNRAERFAYALDGIDALIVGHTHRPFTTQPGKLKVDPHNNIVSIKPFKVISCSSWLDYGGYAARANLLPTTHTTQKLILSAREKRMRVEM